MPQRLLDELTEDQHGVIFVEALLVFPIFIMLTFGILEFGNIMWQRQQVQVGVRDAARYWSRCRTDVDTCNDIARNIAFYGTPGVGSVPRVPGWELPDQLTIDPATLPTTPADDDIVTVAGTVTYAGSPVFSRIFSKGITLNYTYEIRYIGW